MLNFLKVDSKPSPGGPLRTSTPLSTGKSKFRQAGST